VVIYLANLPLRRILRKHLGVSAHAIRPDLNSIPLGVDLYGVSVTAPETGSVSCAL